MKIFMFLALSTLCLAETPDLHFRGVFAEINQKTFGITDSKTGLNRWVSIGGVFEGYTVSEFDEQSETLTLKNGELILKLKLEDARILKASITEAQRIAAEKAMLNDARQLAAACQQYMLETGKDTVEFSINSDGTVTGPIAVYVKIITPSTHGIQCRLKRGGTFSLQRAEAFGGAAVSFNEDRRKQ